MLREDGICHRTGTEPGVGAGVGGGGATDRLVDRDTNTDTGTANAQYVTHQVRLQHGDISHGPEVSTQPHSGPEYRSLDGHTSVTTVQASSQSLQSLPLCRLFRSYPLLVRAVQGSLSMPSNLTKAVCVPIYIQTHAQKLPEV